MKYGPAAAAGRIESIALSEISCFQGRKVFALEMNSREYRIDISPEAMQEKSGILFRAFSGMQKTTQEEKKSWQRKIFRDPVELQHLSENSSSVRWRSGLAPAMRRIRLR